MHGRTLYQFLFELYDFAEVIASKIQPDELDNPSYFLTLIYIEDIMDIYGRGMINALALDSGNPSIDPATSLKDANQRIELLRKRIRFLSQEYNFDEALRRKGEQIYQDWHLLENGS